MGTGHISVQGTLDRLTKYEDERLAQVKLRRARTVFNKKIFKRTEDRIFLKIETEPPPQVRTTVYQVLQKWAKARPFSWWFSEHLPQHLNLPLTTFPEDCYIVQALVLGEDLPLLLLTLYTQDSVDEDLRTPEEKSETEGVDSGLCSPLGRKHLKTDENEPKTGVDSGLCMDRKQWKTSDNQPRPAGPDSAPCSPLDRKQQKTDDNQPKTEGVDSGLCSPLDRKQQKTSNDNQTRPELIDFGVTCARMLTMSLLNFCHREFLILPCTLILDATFTAEALQAEVARQLDDVREYYRGPERLGKTTCEELERAVAMAATATAVPCFLREGKDRKKEWLQIMDRDWDRSMRHVMHALLGSCQVSVTYTTKTETKVKSAVLEAARRISYSQRVVVVTPNDAVHRTVRCLSQSGEEEHGLDPASFTSVAPEDSVPDADCVIAVDVADVTQLQHRRLKMTVSKQLKPDGTGPVLRVLLIGGSGSGKSSTANTLLGEQLFQSGVSLACVTKNSQLQRRLCQGREIEVVDNPGIHDLTRDTGVGGENLTRGDNSYLWRGFDVVCYVMRIERFTEEKERVFQRLKDVLGHEVVNHMMIVFTCGDQITPGEDIASILEKAPERLRSIAEQCKHRYVVFDNTRPGNKEQLRQFFAMVDKVKEHVNRRLFFCPSADDIQNNQRQAFNTDWELRMSQINTPPEEKRWR